MNEKKCDRDVVGRVPSPGVAISLPLDAPPRRLRRLHRVWSDRNGNISYLLTVCVNDRKRVLNNEETFQRVGTFLLESPNRYHWFGRRFVIMPDHLHVIAHTGHDAVRLGEWIKALKAAVIGRFAGRVPVSGEFKSHDKITRLERAWRWQDGYHDHKFRTPESESRKWEYVCLNPVRYGLVQRPEEWPFGGEIYYDQAGGPVLVRGTPPLLETGLLIETAPKTPGEGTRPTS
jgi:putative transposase